MSTQIGVDWRCVFKMKIFVCFVIIWNRMCHGLVYEFHNETKLTYHDARTACQNDSLDLLVLQSTSDIMEINNFLMDIERSQHIWMGLDKLDKTNFTWLDGAEISSYTNWELGEPDGWGYQHCVCIQKDNLRWNSRTCGTKFHFLCGPLLPNYNIGGLMLDDRFRLYSKDTSILSVDSITKTTRSKIRCAHYCTIQIGCIDFSLSSVGCKLHIDSLNGTEYSLLGTNLWSRRAPSV